MDSKRRPIPASSPDHHHQDHHQHQHAILLSNLEVLELLRSRIESRAAAAGIQPKDSQLQQEQEQQQDSAEAFDNATKASSMISNKKTKSTLLHRDWIEQQVVDYLNGTPCTRLNGSRRIELQSILRDTGTKRRAIVSSSTSIPITITSPSFSPGATATASMETEDNETDDNSMTATTNNSNSVTATTITTGFGLTEAESLQILNFVPTELVEIHLMIEELHTRMSERQQDSLLTLISSYVQKNNNEHSINIDLDDDEEQKRKPSDGTGQMRDIKTETIENGDKAIEDEGHVVNGGAAIKEENY